MTKISVLLASMALVAIPAAAAASVHITVTPATVAAGARITIRTSASPCLTRDQITLISSAFPGHAFGEGAVYGAVRAKGAFTVHARIRRGLKPGRYTVGARCGGGNLGVTATFRVR